MYNLSLTSRFKVVIPTSWAAWYIVSGWNRDDHIILKIYIDIFIIKILITTEGVDLVAVSFRS